MGPEADAVANWNDAEALAQQLGSTTDLPDAPLSITAPGDESGTYDSFIELALGDLIEAQFGPDEAAIDENTRLRTPGGVYVASANDNAIIQGVGGFPTSLGFVGLAYAEENADQVKILGVDGGDGCVAASPETVADGTLPDLAPAVHLPQPRRAPRQRGDRRLRRLLPVRCGHRQRQRVGLRGPAGRGAGGHARSVGSRQALGTDRYSSSQHAGRPSPACVR